MATTRVDEDYMICREYQEQINKINPNYTDFISFQHANTNHYFAWVNDKDIILRSEAYPSDDKMERGIKAVIKNRDIVERYSVEEHHGVYHLILWGGGDHQKHTGNFESHNEIGRSCPKRSRKELHDMLLFKGRAFADAVVPLDDDNGYIAPIAAVATIANAASALTNDEPKKAMAAPIANTITSASDSGGMAWWKWLLPLLLLPLLFFLWKGCNKNKAAELSSTIPTIDTSNIATTGSKLEDAKTNNAPPPPPPSCDLHWIFFDYDKFNINSDSDKELNAMAEILKKNADFTGELKAYTDAKGTDEYNNTLSANRAEAAKKVLIGLGIEGSRISTSALSESGPIAQNTEDDSGRQYNRRVELRIKDKSGNEVCRSIPPNVPAALQQ